MRKYIKYKMLGLAFLAVSFAACDTADQDTAPVISPDNKPVATFTIVKGSTTATEGDTIVYEITTDKMIERSITFSLKQTGGTADEEDYSCPSVTMAPYTTSVQLVILTSQDFDFTASETIIGEIGAFSIADRYLLAPGTTNPTPTITLNNWVSDDLKVAFSWDQEVLIDGDPYDASEHIDFDFFVSVAEGFDILDPWATEIGIYDAATGSHPEELTLSGLDDGTYILWADLFYSDFAGESNDSSLINIVTSFTRQGTSLVDLTVDQDESQKMVANQAGFDNDPTGVFDGVCAKVVVAGGHYTILAYDDTEMGSAKASAVRARRPAHIPVTK